MDKTKEQAILLALAGFSENFRKVTTKELSVLWISSLKDLSMEAILKGTRRCLTECEFYPTIAVFREKASGTTPGQWPDAPQIEYVKKGIPMPDNFKNIIKDLMNSAKEVPKHGMLCSLPVHGVSEHGLEFKMTRDAYGRDYVYYKNQEGENM